MTTLGGIRDCIIYIVPLVDPDNVFSSSRYGSIPFGKNAAVDEEFGCDDAMPISVTIHNPETTLCASDFVRILYYLTMFMFLIPLVDWASSIAAYINATIPQAIIQLLLLCL